MNNWMLQHLYDYWDARDGAIHRFSHLLEAAPEQIRKTELDAIDRAIARHVEALNDENLSKMAFVLAEDLYKAGNDDWVYNSVVSQYLSATSGAFLRELTKRGYVIQYVIDNTFEDRARPFKFFPLWFGSAGFIYVCPQRIADDLMTADTEKPSSPHASRREYLLEARQVSDEAVRKCQADFRHFIFLDIDSEKDSFETVKKQQRAPGVIFVFRNEAAVPGSKAAVVFPPGPRT